MSRICYLFGEDQVLGISRFGQPQKSSRIPDSPVDRDAGTHTGSEKHVWETPLSSSSSASQSSKSKIQYMKERTRQLMRQKDIG